MTKQPDSITIVAQLACRQHDAGRVSDEELFLILEKLINARALENGYADQYGMPFDTEEL